MPQRTQQLHRNGGGGDAEPGLPFGSEKQQQQQDQQQRDQQQQQQQQDQQQEQQHELEREIVILRSQIEELRKEKTGEERSERLKKELEEQENYLFKSSSLQYANIFGNSLANCFFALFLFQSFPLGVIIIIDSE